MTPRYVNQGEIVGLVFYKNKETGETMREHEQHVKPHIQEKMNNDPNWIQCDKNWNALVVKAKAKKKATKPKK